jgi:acid phosphatase
LKKFLVSMAVGVGLVTGPVWIPAQQSSPGPVEPVTTFAPVAPGEHIANLDVFKDQLKRYQECTCKCGCYAADLDLQARRAVAFLRRRAAHGAKEHKLAVVFDIDETTLSNYPEMLKNDFEFSQKAFDDWVDSGAAKAIPGTLNIYNEARKLGLTVFFLTGRTEAQRDATERNLRAQGYGSWQQLIMRSPEQSSSNAIVYKPAARAEIVKKGYRIVLNVGDQWSDLRGKPEAEYSVKYPNPYYYIK